MKGHIFNAFKSVAYQLRSANRNQAKGLKGQHINFKKPDTF